MFGDKVWCKARVYSSFLFYFLGIPFFPFSSSIYLIYLLLSVLVSLISTFPLSFILYSSIICPLFFNFPSFIRTFLFSFSTSVSLYFIYISTCLAYFRFPLPFFLLTFFIYFAHYPFFSSFFPNFCFFCAVQMYSYVTKLLSVKQYFVIGCELV